MVWTIESPGYIYHWHMQLTTKSCVCAALSPTVSNIISIATTHSKTYLASADSGPKNSLIVWHAKTGKIVFIVSGYFLDGVKWMCFSGDDNILLTLSGGIPQVLSLWNWKKKEMLPFSTYSFTEKESFQHFATFHTKDSTHFISCSKKDVTFFKLDNNRIIKSVLSLDSLYDESIKSVLTIDPTQRICLRMMQAFTSHCAITCLGICENLIVVGTSESKVCFFNETFQLLWSIKVPGNSIAAVSFNFKPKFGFKQAVLKALGRKLKKESPFERNDFIVCTDDGYAGYVKISSSEITDVLSGTAYTVKSVVVHPTKHEMMNPRFIPLHNPKKKAIVMHRCSSLNAVCCSMCVGGDTPVHFNYVIQLPHIFICNKRAGPGLSMSWTWLISIIEFDSTISAPFISSSHLTRTFSPEVMNFCS
ncbi:cilia-and flagella-associated protein [Trichonephila inaurata madagascariensis]|uniref:Cilia-and flagella-associated protein n=1 Tax=Trichonephila inaurata madagascariensis TaxID=2747483 RepID=A0A8X7CF37_9ARAC|nr:cilia-and flagella-associated protein [Trichonephila inaurata madagascariensis]